MWRERVTGGNETDKGAKYKGWGPVDYTRTLVIDVPPVKVISPGKDERPND